MSEQSLIAFIAVTGKPTEEQLVKMTLGYKNLGINDILIYPRTGLAAEYMSEEWRKIVEIFLNCAKENDMRVWLYDEMNWPSGTCDGQVYYEDYHYYNRRFFIENGEVKVYQYVFKHNKNDWPFTLHGKERSKYYDDHEECVFRLELDPKTGEVIAEVPFCEYTETTKQGYPIKQAGIDLLNPDAMKCFIRLTHERYYEWFGEDFGTCIPGIFTDEPSYRHGISDQDPRTQYCYYDGILDDYKNEFGSDMIEDMLAHEFNMPDNNFLANYNVIVGRRFKYSFMDTIYNWCDAHNLKYTGHMVHDDSVTESCEYSGEYLKTISGFHIPGVDEIYTLISNKVPFLGLDASCGATADFLFSQLENQRRNGKAETMVELYALGPYNISIAQRARALYYVASFGVNDYFCGTGHLDAKGNFLRGEWFSLLSYAPNDSEAFKELSAHAIKARKIAEKIPTVNISVRYPYNVVLNTFGKDGVADYDILLKNVVQILGDNQYGWRLIGEDEESKTDITVSFAKNGIIEESTGKYYTSAAAWHNDNRDKFRRRVTVKEMSGVLADDVFVREFTDGTYVVLNRANTVGTARNVIVEVDGKEKIVQLLDYGVYTGEDPIKFSTERELIAKNVEVSLNGNERFFRCNFFGNHSYTFETETDLYVKMHICTYPEKRDVFLDGDLLEYSLPETEFTDCYNGLYTVSEPVKLKKGKHTLSIHEFDCNFLPMIIFEGNIISAKDTDDDGVEFDVIKTAPEYINPNTETEFYGTASLHFDLQVPTGGATAVIDDFGGLCEFIIDGESVAKKASAPYVFDIDERFAERDVHCEIKYYSNYGALYGNVDEFDKKVRTRSDWVRLVPAAARKETVSMNGLRIFAK